MDTEWKKELKIKLDSGVNITTMTDDEFFKKYGISMKDIWDYVFDEYKPSPLKQCIGCKFLNVSKDSPCNKCSRKVKLKDYYEEETSR